MTAPAEELKAAVETLRSSHFIGLRYSKAPVSGLLRARAPLAKALEDTAELHEPKLRGHAGRVPPGCQWCGDEDFPCLDMRNALAIARAINDTEATS